MSQPTPKPEPPPARWERAAHALALGATLALVFFLGFVRIPAVDFWWQLRTGQIIVSTGQIPYTDPFSWTANGQAWLVQEWLTESLFYLLWTHTPSWCLVLYKTLLGTVAIALVMRRTQDRKVGFWIIVAAGVLSGYGLRPYIDLRPQMVTFVGIAALLWLLDAYNAGRARWLPWALPAAFVLWANMHSGVLVGLALFAIWFLAELAQRWFRRAGYAGLPRLGLAGLVAAAGISLNPNGIHLYAYPAQVLSHPKVMDYITEWFSPNFHRPIVLAFEMTLLGCVALIGIRRRARWTDLALLVAVGHLALYSMRNTAVFALVAVPPLAEALQAFLSSLGARVRWDRLPSGRQTSGRAGVAVIALALLGLGIWTHAPRQAPADWFDTVSWKSYFPVEAARRLKAGQWPGPIYNDYSWGGYLIWHAYPEVQVFTDGRAEVYYESGAFDDERKIHYALKGFEDTLERRGVRTVLTRDTYALARSLDRNAAWELVFEGKPGIVYTRREATDVQADDDGE